MEIELDEISWKLLALLQEDARRSFRQLGRAVGLSAPAVAERVRRMEEAGVITGYHAAINPKRVGYTVLAQMRIGGVGHRVAAFSDLVTATPQVLECHRVTGSDSFLLKIVAASIAQLELLIDRFAPFGDVTTALVLSSPVVRRTLVAPQE